MINVVFVLSSTIPPLLNATHMYGIIIYTLSLQCNYNYDLSSFYLANKSIDNGITICYTLGMDKEIKDKNIQFRITADEKKQIERAAKDNGFDSISAFLLFLFRKYGKK